MFACNNLLLKAARVAVHDDVRFSIAVLCTHTPDQGRTIPLKASR